MKRFIYIMVVLTYAMIFSCSKEEALSPSNLDQDFYARKDNPDNQIDHLIYQIYEETNIPIIYNDTVGEISLGFDENNVEYFLYQIADLRYQIIGNDLGRNGLSGVLLEEDEDIFNGINMLKDEVIPKIPKQVYVHSFLLLDHFELYNGRGYYEVPDMNTHLALTTMAIAKIDSIKFEDEGWRKNLVSDILVDLFSNSINKDYPEIAEGFSDLAYNEVYDIFYYNKFVNSYGYEYSQYNLPFAPREEYGFVGVRDEFSWDPGGYETYQNSEMDIKSFIELLLNYPESVILEKYADYPIILKKYNLIKSVIVDEWGVVL